MRVDNFCFPLTGRALKTRQKGLTMMMDKGLGISASQDLLALAGDYLDLWKLGFGTAALYHDDALKEKIQLAEQHEVLLYFGGTFLEIALWQNRLEAYLLWQKNLGIQIIEVSDGTIALSATQRVEVIHKAQNMGFVVLSEIGKKHVDDEADLDLQIKQIKDDLATGVWKVIVEGRESGKGIGIYDGKGQIKADHLQRMSESVQDPTLLLWEAPLKSQQVALISQFGNNVNLGNISSSEILALEALRSGLRGDTFRLVLKGEEDEDRNLWSARRS